MPNGTMEMENWFWNNNEVNEFPISDYMSSHESIAKTTLSTKTILGQTCLWSLNP